MPTRIETDRDGNRKFVRSNSTREHRRYYQYKCFDDCAGRSEAEWDSLLRQYWALIETTENSQREIQTLKNDLGIAGQEIQRLRVDNNQLYNENFELARRHHPEDPRIGQFQRRIADQRREIDQEKARADRKERENRHLRQQNHSLTGRIRELIQDNGVLGESIRRLEDRLANLTNRYHQLFRSKEDAISEKDQIIDRLRKLRRGEYWDG